LVVAEAGYEVVGIDSHAGHVAEVSAGTMPYKEERGEELLRRNLALGRIRFQTDVSAVATCDVVIIVIGTPVDENLNARIDPLLELLGSLTAHLHVGQLLVLRSTVSPGTTELFRDEVQSRTGLVEGRDVSVVFAPERVLQGHAISEIAALPQLIGAFNEEGFRRAELFFGRFVQNRMLRLTPKEAEIGKLMTNMARYVSFALANEFYLIADSFGANAHKIIHACNMDYPRLNIPRPGPNVGGPCLYKDGFYLLTNMPFAGLISTAFRINESMPAVIAKKVLERYRPKRVGVLGLTFKANCDDTRNSLSFKLKKLFRNARCEVVTVDPYVEAHRDFSVLAGVDALVLMTPHAEFRDLQAVLAAVRNPKCVVVDLWNFWSENVGLSHDGVYSAGEARMRMTKGRSDEDSGNGFGRVADAEGYSFADVSGPSGDGCGQFLPVRPESAE
jgi:UDP-N-acetyl-D-mannosaminuronic acid dehydrogenase